MPCNHKFQEYLNLDNINFEPNTLLVGTFNPSWPEGNQADWFYGRTRNNYLWDVLPRIYDENANLRGSSHTQWKQFCSEKGIALTDMITSILVWCSAKVAHNASGLLLCWYLIMSSPELKPNKITYDEVNNKCSIELRPPDIS